jgi:hypothetical protein
MSQPISQELFTKQILALLQETFEKVEGIFLDRATSLSESLETLAAHEASTPITSDGTTIASQVHHVRFYLRVLNDYIDGKWSDKVDWKSSWQNMTVSEREWNSLRQSLKEDYKSLQTHLNEITGWNDEHRLGGALAIVVHTAYHLGAIRQIMKVVKAK